MLSLTRPFGINYSNNYTKTKHQVLKGDEAKFSYLEFGREAYRILKENTAIFIFIGWSEYPEHYKQLESCGFSMKEPLICQKRASGKALCVDTPMPTKDGWKTMGELIVGDDIFDENGNLCKVKYVTDKMYGHKCYKIYFSDGDIIIADAEHLWLTETKNDLLQFKKGKKDKSYFIRTTEAIKQNLYVGKKSVENNHTVPFAKYLNLPEINLPIHPYLLGYWLGDGNSSGAYITCSIWDFENIKSNIEEVSGTVGQPKCDKARFNTCYFRLSPRKKGICKRGHYLFGKVNCRECKKLIRTEKPLPDLSNIAFQSVLRSLKLLYNKYIPQIYLRSSYAQRMELLRGLMDSDGYVSKSGECVFTNLNKTIAEKTLELIRSLGFKASMPLTKHTKKGKRIYNIFFHSLKNKSVFKLNRKKDRERSAVKIGRRKITKIEETLSVPVKCIQVDSNSGLYLAGKGFIPTHNTDLYGSFQTNSDWIIFAHKGRFKFKKTNLVKNKKAGVVPNIGRQPVPLYKTRFPSCWFGEEYPWSSENSAYQKANNIYHPTIKGLEFCKWLILLSTESGDLVVDPFVGSGTTAVAASMLSRNYLACEINAGFFETAKKRLDYLTL